jgi:hypothetical protein
VAKARADGVTALDGKLLDALRARYDDAVAWGIATNAHRDWPSGRHPGYTLARRLQTRTARVWRSTPSISIARPRKRRYRRRLMSATASLAFLGASRSRMRSSRPCSTRYGRLTRTPLSSRAGPAMNGADRVATPLLQLVMETIWEHERAEGSCELRLSTLQNLEGVEKIVDTHLGNALRGLSEDERQIAIDTFDHLVTPSGGKIAESVPDLAHRTGHSEEQIGQVLEKLDHARIVRPVPAPPGQDTVRFRRYEIFHDVLAPAINRTITANEEQRRARQLRLARRARWLRLVRSAGVTVSVVIALGAWFAFVQRNTAIVQRNLAVYFRATAEALEFGTTDTPLAAQLNLAAYHMQPSQDLASSLESAENTPLSSPLVAGTQAVYSVAYSPDGRTLASGDGDGCRHAQQQSGPATISGANIPASSDNR